MSRMILVLWLTLGAFVGEAFGQKEFYTNGTSGQACGPARHHCLSTAKCNKKKAMCYCKPPLVGSGKLGCFRPDDAVVFLQSDPHLKTFDGESLNMDTPCRYKVMHYTMATFNSTRASAEVYAKNTLSKGGEYYVTSVLITVSVMTETKVGKHSILFEGSAANGTYKFVTTVLEDSMSQSSLKIQMDFTKFIISVSTDDVDNFVIARADGVGLTARFRPPPSEEEDHQKMLPGVTMVIDKEVVGSVKFVNGTLSSSPHGISIKDQAEFLGLEVQLYVYLLAIYNTPAIIMSDRVCKDTSVVFKNLCRNDASRIHLLKTCVSLYADKDFLGCLYDKRKMDKQIISHRLLFRYCAQSFCLQRVDICQAMMELVRSTQCLLPSTLREFNCSTNALRVN